MAVYTTVDDAGSFFDANIYAGTGAELAITGTGFQPDLNWIKNRDATDNHVLTDAVRGATKTIFPNYNDPSGEATVAEGLKSFDSDGYTLGTDVRWNTSTENYVGWNWKMGTTSGLSGGTLTPDGYSFNATAGQGIYEYTGDSSANTITHGLDTTPTFMINKRIGNQEWKVYHVYNGPTKYMVLDQNDAVGTHSNNWDDTAPTSTVFTIGSDLSASFAYMQYVFSPIQGYSRFGSYTGNGNVDGPYVYTGFRPAYILIKNTEAAKNWQIYDNERSGYNKDNDQLFANTTAVEDTAEDALDILSNGFKIRVNSDPVNLDTDVMIYAAFAESPFVNSKGIPTNGR